MRNVRFIIIIISIALLIYGFVFGNNISTAVSSLLALIVWIWEFYDNRIDAGEY